MRRTKAFSSCRTYNVTRTSKASWSYPRKIISVAYRPAKLRVRWSVCYRGKKPCPKTPSLAKGLKISLSRLAPRCSCTYWVWSITTYYVLPWHRTHPSPVLSCPWVQRCHCPGGSTSKDRPYEAETRRRRGWLAEGVPAGGHRRSAGGQRQSAARRW